MLKLTETKYQRGLVNQGTQQTLDTFLEKIQKKEKIVYGAIGGSITAGAKAEPSKEKAYAPLFAKWLKSKTECQFINAGIGATTSMYGAFRAQRDILCYKPDIITIEFAVNDKVNPDTAASFEYLVRQCVTQKQNPLVILIFTMFSDGSNFQNIHIPIGQHYNLPMLSYRDTVYLDIESGKLNWIDISDDEVHPNNDGHAFIYKMLKKYIESPTDTPCLLDRYIPKYLNPIAQKYEGGRIITPAKMEVKANKDWQIISSSNAESCYHAESPGASMTLEFIGQQLTIGCEQYAGDFGKIEVLIDDKAVVVIDGFYKKPEVQEWAGGHTVLTILAKDLPNERHSVKIKLLDEKHPGSKGYNFNIRYLLVN